MNPPGSSNMAIRSGWMDVLMGKLSKLVSFVPLFPVIVGLVLRLTGVTDSF